MGGTLNVAILLVCLSAVCGMRFLSKPQKVKVQQFETVTFECQLDENNASKPLLWLKLPGANLFIGNTPLGTNKRLQVDVAPSASQITSYRLTIHNVTEADAANYKCQVAQTSLDQEHTLVVLVPPTAAIIPNKETLTLKLGEKLDLKCNTTGKPKPSVIWNKAGLYLGNVSHSGEDGRLVINEVGRKSGGIYECFATNGAGFARDSIDVKVLFAPSVKIRSDKVVTALGSEVKLECHFSAYPEPRIMWSHGNNTIPSSDMGSSSVGPQARSSYGDTISPLIIRRVTEKDLGFYECEGHNDLGNASAQIFVTALPQDLKITSAPMSAFSDQYTLTWEVRSEEMLLDYNMLFRPLVPVTTTTTTTTTARPMLANLTVPDETNNSSCANCTTNNAVSVKNDSSSDDDDDDGDMESEDHEEEGQESLWHKATIPAVKPWPKSGKHEQSYTFKDLKQNSTYIVKLQAKNTFGLSDWTEEFQFSTSPEAERSSTVKPTVPVIDDKGNHSPASVPSLVLILLCVLVRWWV